MGDTISKMKVGATAMPLKAVVGCALHCCRGKPMKRYGQLLDCTRGEAGGREGGQRWLTRERAGQQQASGWHAHSGKALAGV